MNNPETITEEMKVHEQWYKDAKTQTLETLPEFLRHILEDYRHDYGTIVHALASGSVATAWAMNNHKNGGITGFQASGVMWQFIRGWNNNHNKCGMSLLDYDNLLYPQYADRFEKTLSVEHWKAIQEQAQIKINEADAAMEKYTVDKAQYDIDIAAYVEKHPDYYENRKHYDSSAGLATTMEHEAKQKQHDEGFEFAPDEPFRPTHERVYDHWKSIVEGQLPFGFTISEK